MPGPGQPKKLDHTKRAEVCALVAAGVNVREAARFVGCDRKTIHNEARRNHEFHRQLQQARSQAQVHPLRTMHEAAATNWRAAAWWLERLAPEAFAQPAAAVLGQREANKFAADLIEIIERVVSNPLERERLYELVTATLPAAMRRTWDHRQSRRKLERAMVYFDGKPTTAADGDPPNWSSTPEPRPETPIERVLATFNEQLRQAAQAAKRPSPAARDKPAPVEKFPPADNCFAPPGKNAVRSSTRQVKTGPKSQDLPPRRGEKSGEFFPTQKIEK
jgi:hypothetical protein